MLALNPLKVNNSLKWCKADLQEKFIAEKDEGIFITKRKATLQALANINSQNGGRGLSGVGNYYAQGGQVITSGTDIDLIRTVVAETISNVNIVTKVEDIQTGLIDYNNVRNAGII